MRAVMFYHSLVSDWNHGNAHFLRGVAAELQRRGAEVHILEPVDGWSRSNLVAEHGEEPLEEFAARYPDLHSTCYANPDHLDLGQVLGNADLVLVHEWTAPSLVKRIGDYHRTHPSPRLYFHDTHHRAISAPEEMQAYDLQHYDGILAFGDSLRQRYLQTHPHLPAFTWHEAADTNIFRPLPAPPSQRDVAWVGNWGDGERTAELAEFLLRPVGQLGVQATVHGVRYPRAALAALTENGLTYRGWIANYRIPEVFAAHRVTLHVPRRPYTKALPGIPTIRVFEALACGIPLICAPWHDCEQLFRPGVDYLTARSGEEMSAHLQRVLSDDGLRQELREKGLETICARHTCAHRVDELMEIVQTC